MLALPMKKKLFYGWRIVGAGALIQVLQAALLHQAFGAYVAVLGDEKGWSKTALSGAAALQSAESALIGPLLGWLLDRFGPRGMVRAGVIILGVGFMLFSQVDSLLGFYAAFIVIALGASLCGFFPLNIAIIHWFERYRARAFSGFTLGLSLGGVLMPIVAWSLQVHGWRITAFASGVLIIAAGWPLARVVRNRPEEMGELPDGRHEPAGRSGREMTVAAGAPPRDFTTREALRSPAFWLVSLGHGCAMLVVFAVNVHAITHMKEGLGFSLAEASLVITVMTVFQGLGVMLGWLVGDRYAKHSVAGFCMLLHAVGLLLLTFATGWLMLMGFAVVHGLGWGLRGPLMNAIRADYFGRRSIGMIIGISSIVVVGGHVTGPMIAGAMADWTGDYRAGFSVIATLVCVGALLFYLAKPPRD